MKADHLRKHKINAHSGMNDFNCEDCGKHFTTQTTLEVHQKFVHQGHPGYTCEFCGKNFRQRNHCREHQEADHLNIRYSCNQPGCEKNFKFKRYLKMHLRKSHQILEIKEDPLGLGDNSPQVEMEIKIPINSDDNIMQLMDS